MKIVAKGLGLVGAAATLYMASSAFAVLPEYPGMLPFYLVLLSASAFSIWGALNTIKKPRKGGLLLCVGVALVAAAIFFWTRKEYSSILVFATAFLLQGAVIALLVSGGEPETTETTSVSEENEHEAFRKARREYETSPSRTEPIFIPQPTTYIDDRGNERCYRFNKIVYHNEYADRDAANMRKARFGTEIDRPYWEDKCSHWHRSTQRQRL